MKTVGILLESFMDWGGGIDFISNLTLALQKKAKSNNIKLVFLNNEFNYMRLVGPKRKLIKFKELYINKLFNIHRERKPICFQEFKSIKYFHYNTKDDLQKIIDKKQISSLLFAVNDGFKDLNISVFCYLFDCQHKYFPEYFPDDEIKNRDLYFLKMIKTYSKIIVVANSVKSDLVKFYDANPDQIYNLPFAPILNSIYLKNNIQCLKKYNLPKRFFIISNQFWIHKNYETAFRAIAELIKDEDYKDVKLICTGKMEDYRKPDYINELNKLIKELNLENQIICLGFIPKIDQIEIMKYAIALIQPTLFEGGPGGGSVWDALSLGIYSILSDINTNLEIKNELAIFFHAKDPINLATKMKEVINTNYIKKTDKELIDKSEKNIQVLGNYLYSIILDK
jgi:glycosyltransferase involved in cell wall biosynthesis